MDWRPGTLLAMQQASPPRKVRRLEMRQRMAKGPAPWSVWLGLLSAEQLVRRAGKRQ
jgi:hypothetical protein